jgi:hypothetical protein
MRKYPHGASADDAGVVLELKIRTSGLEVEALLNCRTFCWPSNTWMVREKDGTSSLIQADAFRSFGKG